MQIGFPIRSSGFLPQNVAGPPGQIGFSASRRLLHLQTSEHLSHLSCRLSPSAIKSLFSSQKQAVAPKWLLAAILTR